MKTFKEYLEEACWKGYEQKGMKKKGDRTVPNCVKKESDDETEELNKKEKVIVNPDM